MNNPSFSSICKDVLKNVYPKIQSKKNGVLYHVLAIILEDVDSHRKFLCDDFRIDEDSSLEKDQEFADKFSKDITNLVYLERLKGNKQIKEKLSTLATKGSDLVDELNPLQSNQSKEERKMKLIIIVACLMVGTFACFKYLDRTRSRKQGNSTASLCLAVPASAVYNLHKGYSISRDEIIRLIDSATEFLCEPESKNIPVEIMDEERSPESQLKFYIRINLQNGGNIIGKETQYGMKRELPLNVTGEVTQIGFLKNVSILRTFNRI